MPASIYRFSLLLPLLLIFLYGSAYSIVDQNLRTIRATGGSIRTILASHRKSDPVPDCTEMATKSQCSEKVKCQWCRSSVLDDMCFSKLEARRLPSQVFSCD